MQIVELNTMKVAEESKRILLEGNVTQLRDENTKLKNNIKLLKQREADCDIAQFKNEFISFKNKIAGDIQELKETLKTPSKKHNTTVPNNMPSLESSPAQSNSIPIVPGERTYSETVSDNVQSAPADQQTRNALDKERQADIKRCRDRRNLRERRTVVFEFASSMTRSINKRQINEDSKNGKIVFHFVF